MKPHLTYLISLPHATQIIKKMNVKKHREAGYSYQLEEVEDQYKAWCKHQLWYTDYTGKTHFYKLNIFYEPPKGKDGKNK